ncbi:hypothetical protein CWO85_02685 [Candidatus Phytoplasma ziziphi]|uniref:Uncharacterized protein n=1 Tax=Ziziphus jujuba witches'-broom phytoplasma TaxID=135727 RepID=A0A660HMZ7_ZIZJU|nr:hypothetical protein [Candidatus Phytoplasma ziziphi]AYJ01395.1 hypothetical protein CWO85_02685 [Candidatus Phytoplasma ziziphi]
MQKQKISKYLKKSLLSFLLFVFTFSFLIFFCHLIYGSENEQEDLNQTHKKLYQKQEDNCIQETIQRKEKLFEMFYDFKEDITPMLQSFEKGKEYYDKLPKDQRKEIFDEFLEYYREYEISYIDHLCTETSNEEEIKTLQQRKKNFKLLEKKDFFLDPNVRELGLFQNYKSKKYCNTYNNFFYYLYFDFILNTKLNRKYDCPNEYELCHPEQIDSDNLKKRTQLFSYLPEVTNLQFKIEYLRYFYKILKEFDPYYTGYNFITHDETHKLQEDFSNLIDQWVNEYKKEKEPNRREKLANLFENNKEFIKYLDPIDEKLKVERKEKLINDFDKNLENTRNFLKEMLSSPSRKKQDFPKEFPSKTSLNNILLSPGLNKKELIEHIIHRNDELMNKDLLKCDCNLKNYLYQMYVDYSVFVFHSSCLCTESEKKKLGYIINDKKKNLTSDSLSEKNILTNIKTKYEGKYKSKSEELNEYLSHLKKELDYQTQDIDHRYSDPSINPSSQENKQFLDTASLGDDLKTIYLQNPEDLKDQLQFQLNKIVEEYIEAPFKFYGDEIKTTIDETQNLIDFINVSDKDTLDSNKKNSINEQINSLTNEIEDKKQQQKNSNIQLSEKQRVSLQHEIRNKTQQKTNLEIKLKENPHHKSHPLKNNLETLTKIYLSKMTEFIDNWNIIDARIQTYKDYFKFKEETILNPYLNIISDLQIQYYRLVTSILKDIEQNNVNVKKEEQEIGNSFIQNTNFSLTSTELTKKNIDEQCDLIEKHLTRISCTDTQDFNWSLHNIEWIGQFLNNYKKALIENFRNQNCNIKLEESTDLKEQYSNERQNYVRKSFQEMQEPQNINEDHNIELNKILSELKEEFKNFEFNQGMTKLEVKNKKDELERKIYTPVETQNFKDYSLRSQLRLLQSQLYYLKFQIPENNEKLNILFNYIGEPHLLDSNIQMFKKAMEELINIVENQHKEEKQIREVNIQIEKNKQHLSKLDQNIRYYSNQNIQEKEQNEINTKDTQTQLQKQIASLTNEIQNKTDDLNTKLREKEQNEINAKNTQTQLQEQIDPLTKEIQNKTKEKEQNEINTKNTQTKLQTQIVSLTNEIEKKTKEKDDLNTKLREKEQNEKNAKDTQTQLQTQIASLTKEIQNKTDDLNTKLREKEQNEINAKNTQTQLQEQIDPLTNEIQNKTKEKEQNEINVKNTQTQLQKQIDPLTNEIEKKTKEKDYLNTKLQEEKQKETIAKERQKKLLTLIDLLEKEKGNKKNEKIDLEQKLEINKKQYASLTINYEGKQNSFKNTLTNSFKKNFTNETNAFEPFEPFKDVFKNYKYSNAKSFPFVEVKFNFIDWLNKLIKEKFPNNEQNPSNHTTYYASDQINIDVYLPYFQYASFCWSLNEYFDSKYNNKYFSGTNIE